MSEKQYQAVCYLCETTLEADTWDELQALKAEHGWKEEYDTGMWITLCPDCWEF